MACCSYILPPLAGKESLASEKRLLLPTDYETQPGVWHVIGMGMKHDLKPHSGVVRYRRYRQSLNGVLVT